MSVDRVGLDIAKLEEDKKTLEFVLKDAEWSIKNTPKEIAKIDAQIRELTKGCKT